MWFQRQPFDVYCNTRVQIMALPRLGKRIVKAYANSKGSGEPAHPRSLTRTYAVHSRRETSAKELDMTLLRGRACALKTVRRAFSSRHCSYMFECTVFTFQSAKLVSYVTWNPASIVPSVKYWSTKQGHCKI